MRDFPKTFPTFPSVEKSPTADMGETLSHSLPLGEWESLSLSANGETYPRRNEDCTANVGGLYVPAKPHQDRAERQKGEDVMQCTPSDQGSFFS